MYELGNILDVTFTIDYCFLEVVDGFYHKSKTRPGYEVLAYCMETEGKYQMIGLFPWKTQKYKNDFALADESKVLIRIDAAYFKSNHPLIIEFDLENDELRDCLNNAKAKGTWNLGVTCNMSAVADVRKEIYIIVSFICDGKTNNVYISQIHASFTKEDGDEWFKNFMMIRSQMK